MTTLDDAAERRCRELAEKVIRPVNERGSISITEAVMAAWTEATEAAAKKCDAMDNDDCRPSDCAAAIRGGKL